jgi:hypothetical protein
MEKLFEKKGKVEIDWKCMHPNKNLPGNVRVKNYLYILKNKIPKLPRTVP